MVYYLKADNTKIEMLNQIAVSSEIGKSWNNVVDFLCFQCYILKKKADPIWHEGHPYPRDVDYMVADTLESLRPKLTVFTSLEEAVESVQNLNKEHQDQIGI